MKNDIKKLAKKLYEETLEEYYATKGKAFGVMVDEKLVKYNDDVKKILTTQIDTMLKDNFSVSSKPYMIDNLSLSKKLHKNAKDVSKVTQKVLNEHLERGSSVQAIRKAIFDGYNYSDKDIIPLNKSLPKYLTTSNKINAMKLKTKPLKTAYLQLLNSKSDKAYEKNLKTVFYERSRYYANRIAQTESARSYNLANSEELLKDDEVDLVRFEMSHTHRITDICDYYASLDVGYGAGVVLVEDMITLPLHPHCRCSYNAYYRRVKKKKVQNPEKHALGKFSDRDKQRILGSEEKLFRWRDGAKAEDIFNSMRPNYPIKKVAGVLGYNGGMKTLQESYIGKNKKYPKNMEPKKESLSFILKKYNIKSSDLIDIRGSNYYEFENAIVYQNNKRLFTKGESANRVKIDTMVIYNSTIIHSHPKGSSFSKEDIDEVLLYGGNEIIAFNDNYFYYFKNALKDYTSIYDTIATAIDETRESLSLRLKRGEISLSEFDFILPHFVWDKVSKQEKGFIYESYAISK